LWLLLRTKLVGSSDPGKRHMLPVNLFFKLDPLAAVVSALAGHALYVGLLWSLVILIPTFFLGRFFCGWICPLGSLNQFLDGIRSKSKPRQARIAANRYKKWQVTKYVLLIAGGTAALCRSSIVGWVDPFSLFVRSIGVSILPAAASKKYYVVYQPHYWSSVLVGVAFLALLAMNLRVTRFWCRALCPLGALLGMTGRWSMLGLRKDPSSCNHCNRCMVDCQGGDDPVGGVPWHKSECHLCLNCVEACPHGSLQFRFSRHQQEVVGTSLGRRTTLAAMAAGLVSAPVLRAQTLLGNGRNERLIRPPGALDESDFLSSCIRCVECVRVCPNNALWSPVLTPKIGYCEPSCVLCTEACPTGAIRELTPKQKGWGTEDGNASTPVRVGAAVYDRRLCLPWAKATDCTVCVEWCPTVPKAIYVEDAQVVDEEGKARTLKQPHVDLNRCVGCGACEFACPLQGQPAVYVTNSGESRSNHR
jgi:polyferredoxin